MGNLNLRALAVGTAGVIVLWALLSFLYTIDAGERGVILRFGAVDRVVAEGIHAKLPFMENVVKMNTRVQKSTTKTEAASRDLQAVHTTIVLNFSLEPDKAGDVYKSLGLGYAERVIEPIVKEEFKAASARYTAEELISKRETLKNEVREYLKNRMVPFGIMVVELSITDFEFSPEFNKAIESKQTAEQLALKAKRDLDRIKVEAQQKIATAQAEAEALRLQRQAVSPELVRLREVEAQMKAIDKWDGHLPNVTGGAVPFLSVGEWEKGRTNSQPVPDLRAFRDDLRRA
ncbi:MAG: prohibitin family protein [Nitrospirae bacterium]|nr:prohibitin family protein [Nitrospirota bacterium]NTW65886.1 prohibitin family protein [Nitrospirota bacterium]